MKELKKKATVTILLGIVNLIFLIFIAIFDRNLTSVAIWIWCVYSVATIVAMFSIFPPKDIVEYGRLYAKQRKAKGDKELLHLKSLNYKYKGVAKTYTRNKVSFLVPLILFFASLTVFFLLFPNKDIETILILIGSFLLFLYQLFLLFFETVTITPEYIRCRHWLKDYTIPWSDIKTVGVSVDRYGIAESWVGNIYLSRERLKDDKRDISKSEINHNFIFLAYRTEVVQHIKANYYGEIKNLSMVKSWIRYLRKNQ